MNEAETRTEHVEFVLSHLPEIPVSATNRCLMGVSRIVIVPKKV
jgi:hypothetical protein